MAFRRDYLSAGLAATMQAATADAEESGLAYVDGDWDHSSSLAFMASNGYDEIWFALSAMPSAVSDLGSPVTAAVDECGDAYSAVAEALLARDRHGVETAGFMISSCQLALEASARALSAS